MADELKPKAAPAVEDKNKAPEAKPAEPKKEQKTIGELTQPKADSAKDIPLAKFLDLKNENKKLRQAVEDLSDKIKDGASRNSVEDSIDDLKALAEETGVDEKVLDRILAAAERRSSKKSEEKLNEKFKTLEEKEKESEQKALISAIIGDSLKDYPEYKEIANVKILKHIFSLPENANKTSLQILEETYGNAIKGRKTIEGSTPRGGGDEEGLDINRAKTDKDYFINVVMKNPKLKAEYNAQLITNTSRRHN